MHNAAPACEDNRVYDAARTTPRKTRGVERMSNQARERCGKVIYALKRRVMLLSSDLVKGRVQAGQSRFVSNVPHALATAFIGIRPSS